MLKAQDYRENRQQFKLYDTTAKKTVYMSVEEVKQYLKSGKRIRGVLLAEDANPIYTVHGLEVNLEYPVRKKVGKWNVVVLYAGDPYGRSLTSYANDVMIQFYDSSVAWNKGKYPLGQFVSSYYAKTILDCHAGLRLDGSISAWTVSAKEMQEIIAWLKEDILDS